MWEQEQNHLRLFDELIKEYQIRPSLLQPFCNAGGWLLGAFSALIGPTTAMACTEAVESVVGNHYNTQLRVLLSTDQQHNNVMPINISTSNSMDISSASECSQKSEQTFTNLSNLNNTWHSNSSTTETLTDEERSRLASLIARCRDEELEHLETAVELDAHSSPVYRIAFNVISSGVSAAIALAHWL